MALYVTQVHGALKRAIDAIGEIGDRLQQLLPTRIHIYFGKQFHQLVLALHCVDTSTTCVAIQRHCEISCRENCTMFH
jgi:hypothetical protein